MSKSKFELTLEGQRKFEEELEYLKNVKRKENIRALQEAREQGDLSENAEYDAARDEQALIESRIAQIENILRNATIIKTDNSDKVTIGKEVVFKEYPDGEAETYYIVGSEEADPFNGKISIDSPVAQALLGHKVNDIVEISSPGESYKIQILDVKIKN